MIKLPDFSKCVEFKRLKQAMGITFIPILPPVKFVRNVTESREIIEPDKNDIKLEKKIKYKSITVNLDEVKADGKGLLEYKGRKVVAYIRDQKRGIDHYNKTSNYKYHLCDCSTMKSMRRAGRSRRYLATKRCDGYFEAYDLSGYGSQKLTVKMELCYNCKMELSVRRLHFTPFSLEQYFIKYDSYIPKEIRRIETVTKTQTYQPNQADLSREYRKSANFKCQSCIVDCSQDHALLHLHHKDGDPSNNKRDNLNILCVDCHSKQPMHSYMTNTKKAKQQIAMIGKLRKQQGIIEFNTV